MPLNDWTRVPAGLFHDFHQSWSIRIKDALNAGRLPEGIFALVEQRSGPREADVFAIESGDATDEANRDHEHGVVATIERPTTRIVRRATNAAYSQRANRIVIKHHLGRTIAVIEIVSPGNKDSRAALRDFVEKTTDFLRAGIHALDLLPPTPRDPDGIHKVIWDEFMEEDFTFPEGQNRILVSYETGDERTAYVEPIAVGDELPDMPLFLTSRVHVMVPLESTYQATWDATPAIMRTVVETGAMPAPGTE